jgi:hypothetical protein
MEKKLARRKMLRRKYKRYAAALAGVTIMAGASLHGIPSVSAAENPSTSPNVTTEQTTQINKDANKQLVKNDAAATDPLANQDQRDTDKAKRHDVRDQGDKRDERYAHEKWSDRGETFAHRMQWYNDSLNKIQIFNNNANAVDIVKAAATDLGFDVNNDSFTLMSQSGSQSVVSVVHNGNNYNVTVDQLANGNWLVSSVNQIQ